MKRTGWKQLAVGIAGGLLCRISVMGCYPLVPAYFAAVYLDEKIPPKTESANVPPEAATAATTV